MAIKDLKEKCVEQLEVMSKKRIKRILAGIGCILHCHIHVYIVIFFQELYDRLYQYINTYTQRLIIIYDSPVYNTCFLLLGKVRRGRDVI